ncbi:aminotransferase DegT [Shewanella sairae]|uniref:Aminotransferase DegT n=1 Tax=Shewanella sairae TaxID=190310 RepID=A0ABQ4PQB4_9GAMM|nr:DegT/DnrJ/EryC1/StrS family aminotransferase [Shewanella sairae]MCL1129267.1 DegT/DnrJ/EryC1/StrS family aminotransferase [Shewanella sairae]GIU51272.1 aminotransferase DegT [Shewanella sairae]
MIPVTKAYLPNKDKYKAYIDRIFESGQLTNSGPLLQELESRLAKYLGVKHVICVANGSLALQVAYKALGLKGEVITTPFSFAATASTLLWEGLTPKFCDIDPQTFNLDPSLIESHITPSTSAILPVHVFGNPCEVEKIQHIADKHGLKVIYDAAHAFGVSYKGQSVLKHGDISTLSFHATKVFHTIEGGAIITESDEIAAKVRLLINFGITGPDKIEGLGTNAKMNEFEAAMGLCVLDDIDMIIQDRVYSHERYTDLLKGKYQFQKWSAQATQNGAYFPIVFESEQALLASKAKLEAHDVFPRRYFYPSLDKAYHDGKCCQTSLGISKTILCLPLSYKMTKKNMAMVVLPLDESIYDYI